MDQKPTADHPISIQTPPDVKIRIRTAGANPTDLIKMVGVGDRPGWTIYRENQEYWRHGTLSFSDDLTLSSDPFGTDETEDTLTRTFFGTSFSTNAIVCPRTSPVWTWGARMTPPGRTGYLYSMRDPDNPQNPVIGLLFEVDGSNVLRAVVAYKAGASAPPGLIWDAKTITNAPLTKLSSTDPRTLTSPARTDWHRTLMQST